MNSNQSLAEALEMCKYTENFTFHGARSCSHSYPSPNPTRQQQKTLFHVQQHLWITDYCVELARITPVKEHNTATPEVTYSCVYQQFTTCDRETKAPRLTSSSIRERSKQEQQGKTKCSKTSARFTHKRQIYIKYILAERICKGLEVGLFRYF